MISGLPFIAIRRPAMFKCHSFLYYVAILAIITFSNTAYGAISSVERSALIALYNSTYGDNWTDNSGWKTPPLHTDGFAMPGTEDTWKGITITNSHVSEIFLIRNQLSGSIPSELGNLSNLEKLYFGHNQISGSIPSELGNLSNLLLLEFFENQLSGSIPSELGNLSNLLYLYLDSNKLSGAIPSELGNLLNLVYLFLENNQLTGIIPSKLGNLSNLLYLYLDSNKLSGNISDNILNLTALVDNGGITLCNNSLYTDNDTVRNFINQKHYGDWESCQNNQNTKSLKIIYPNGDDNLSINQDYVITWDSSNISGLVRIDLYKGSPPHGQPLLTLAAATEDNGRYAFSPYQDNRIVDGNDYYIGISAEDGTVYDFSDASFSIVSPATYTYYRDADGDKFGDKYNSIQASSRPGGYVEDNTDCDDTEVTGYTIHPGAQEIRGDGIDQDCDGEDLPCLVKYYRDFDNDGYVDQDDFKCESDPLDGYKWNDKNDFDCDDDKWSVNPGAVEIRGDGTDQDCDGIDPPSPTADGTVNIYGLFVGIDDPFLGKLKGSKNINAVKDAIFCAFGKENDNIDILLIERSKSTGYHKDDFKRDLEAQIDKADLDDLFIFYSSSHGTFSSQNQGETTLSEGDEYLVYGDYNPDNVNYDYLLSDDDLTKMLLPYNDINKWVIIDACYSGGFWGNGEEYDNSGGDLDSLDKIEFLSSTSEAQEGRTALFEQRTALSMAIEESVSCAQDNRINADRLGLGNANDSVTLSEIKNYIEFEWTDSIMGYYYQPLILRKNNTTEFELTAVCSACDDTSAKSTLNSPSGIVQTPNPSFSWTSDLASTWYRIWINDGDGNAIKKEWYRASSAGCESGNGTCSVNLTDTLDDGNYKWWIKSWNDNGSIWSDGMTFTIQGNDTPPSKVSHTSPAGLLESSMSTFTWQEDPTSTWYKLWVGSPNGDRIFAQWYDAADICSNGNCSVTTGTELMDGDYEWYIKSWNEFGRIWSDGMSFEVE